MRNGDCMKEVWKDVKGFEGLYQISNLGRLKSFRKHKDGYILSQTNQKGWYFTVNLFKSDGTKTTRRIHILVAQHFIGEIPIGWHVHHKDGNKQNNRVDNLEIIHPKSHYQETKKEHPEIVTGMVKYNKFDKPRRIQQYDKEGNFIAEYANAKIASHYTGVCQRNILQVSSGDEYKTGKVRKQAGGFVWKYKDEKGVVLCS